MAIRERRRDRALERARRDVVRIVTEIRSARRGAGLSIRAAAESVRLDESAFGRLERMEIDHPTVDQLALACAAVGLELGVRSFILGEPVRDAGHLRLLERLRARISAELPWVTEAPMPIPGDLRALDGWTMAADQRIGIEAETRLGDLQAVQRRAFLKKRDAALDRLVLLVADTRANRAVLAVHREVLRGAFPLDTRAVLAALSVGRPPAADGIVVL